MRRKTYIFQRMYSGFSIAQLPWFMPVSESPVKLKYMRARRRMLAPSYHSANTLPIVNETVTVDKWLPVTPIPPRLARVERLINFVEADPQMFNAPGSQPDVTLEKYNFYPTPVRYRSWVHYLVQAQEATAFHPYPFPPSGGITAKVTVIGTQGII